MGVARGFPANAGVIQRRKALSQFALATFFPANAGFVASAW